MIRNKCIFLFLAVSFFASYSSASKILSVYSIFSRSHFIVAEVLLKELAHRGHNVRMIIKYDIN